MDDFLVRSYFECLLADFAALFVHVAREIASALPLSQVPFSEPLLVAFGIGQAVVQVLQFKGVGDFGLVKASAATFERFAATLSAT